MSMLHSSRSYTYLDAVDELPGFMPEGCKKLVLREQSFDWYSSQALNSKVYVLAATIGESPQVNSSERFSKFSVEMRCLHTPVSRRRSKMERRRGDNPFVMAEMAKNFKDVLEGSESRSSKFS
ncbi:hypothetical protein SCLCIDRAFT_947467 [Scleroderma citrinum Foug A]|uniref:Uncharacterized protein n=1 Tax=Scleroderma citrinum Foug A TaxID=1036808 RepID=A0A0C2ZFE6_9AGAM|nr:hypothetical protein SCLCIDRAFT_947467 [Scleroderma citrinum Foug A]